MKTFNRMLCILLATVLFMGTTTQVFAEIVYEDIVGEEKVSVGADLSESQKATVYNYFGIEQGSVDEVVVTIDDERSYLEGVIDSSKMGTRSLSSIHITLTEEGSGLDITLHNINWLTKEIYQNALTTVGITNAKITIASPVAVSGTAALTGIYKAYESITGESVDENTKQAATEELVTTGDLADEIGSEEAAALVNEIKLEADELSKMDDEKAKDKINSIAINLNITLSDEQLQKLLELARTFENIDLSGVQESLKSISNKLGDLLDIDQGFWAKVGNFFGSIGTAIGNFFSGIFDFFANLFTGGNDSSDVSSDIISDISDESSFISSSESISESSDMEADSDASSSDETISSNSDDNTSVASVDASIQ